MANNGKRNKRKRDSSGGRRAGRVRRAENTPSPEEEQVNEFEGKSHWKETCVGWSLWFLRRSPAEATSPEQEGDENEVEEETEDRAGSAVVTNHTENENGVTVGDVDVPSVCGTAKSTLGMSAGYYTAMESDVAMKNDNLRLEKELGMFVAERVFPDWKFSVGNVVQEKKMCLLAVRRGMVRLQSRVDPGHFAEKYYDRIASRMSKLRQNAHNRAKDKFTGKWNRGG